MTKWRFDRKLLKDSLQQCQRKLQDKTIPLIYKFEIEEDETFFSNMLNGNYSNEKDDCYYYEGIEDDLSEYEEKYSFEEIKERILIKCMDYINQLGNEIIDLMIELYEDDIFYIPAEDEEYFLSMDEQEEYTIKNYESHSKKLLIPAKKILDGKKLIQASTKDKITSYTQFPYSIDLPFIIVNPNERNSILNHELEHASEFMLNIGRDKNGYLLELGSIYFEMLFCDLLYKETNKKYSSDYKKRVTESYTYIYDLYPIFVFIKELQKRKFKVRDEEFQKLCNDILEVTPDNLEDFLNIGLEEEFEPKLRYLLSHLKAIELREKTNKNDDSLDILLEEFMKPLTHEEKKVKEKKKIYKRYLNEIECKR